MKRLIRDHLDGADGRAKVARWVPRWLGFPATSYTAGGSSPVEAPAGITAAREPGPAPDAGEGPVAEAA